MAKLNYENSKELPVCPYCEKKMNKILVHNNGYFFRNKVYICPNCKKFLGASSSRN